jgi:RimJ/RimL family protein N-acetyltransferase
MQINSLGFRTDLIFSKFEGAIQDRDEYLVIRTSSNPGYFWGNYLLFPAPPASGDYEKWTRLFEKEISSQQPTHHIAFGWDNALGEPGEVQPFLDAGFRLSQGVVLTARQVAAPAKYNRDVHIRPLREDWEWNQALENQIACQPVEYEKETGYREFKTIKMRQYRQMKLADKGEWFGAFINGQLVADLGLFCVDGIGRFQQVETAPAFRRQGICGALVHQAAQYGFKHLGAQTLVMVADEHYHAAKIYESVGFQPAERQVGVEFWK